jgi:hypothetical protein
VNTLTYCNYELITVVKNLMRLHTKVRILVYTANIRLGWMCLTGANTLAYYNYELITIVKNLMRLHTKVRILVRLQILD